MQDGGDGVILGLNSRVISTPDSEFVGPGFTAGGCIFNFLIILSFFSSGSK